MQYGELARRRNFEDRSTVVGSTEIRGAVKIPIASCCQTGQGLGAVGASKIVQCL